MTLSELTNQSRLIVGEGRPTRAWGRQSVPENRQTGRSREEIERLILDCAEQVFAERGFGGATMQTIADQAGLPKANLHYYFVSKEALYRRVVERIFNIWLEAADSFETSATPDARWAATSPARWRCRAASLRLQGLGQRGDAGRADHPGLSGGDAARLDRDPHGGRSAAGSTPG
jgi:AcrR family transcriptional regulator